MPHDLSAFSQSYAQARSQFLAAASAAGLAVQSLAHPLPGRDCEALDVALAGSPTATKLLVISSAVHGVEGNCGSGVQVHSLRHTDWFAGRWPDAQRGDDVAVLYLHAVNPWGFSHGRRVMHENVDLNRNFVDFDQPLPLNAGYRSVHDLLLPAQWPPSPAHEAGVAQFIATQGMPALQAAVSSGQYEFADGLFYGGHAPTWSHLALRQVLREHTRHTRQLA